MFKVGDVVVVTKAGLASTGKVGVITYVYSGRGGRYQQSEVKLGTNTLNFSNTSLDFYKETEKQEPVPAEAPASFKIGCEAVKQVLQHTFASEEAAIKRMTEWSTQLGGKSVQLYKQVAEYEVKISTQLIKVG